MGMALFYTGALGMFLTFGVFGEEPIAGALRQNPTGLAGPFILFGFAGLSGILLLFVRSKSFIANSKTLLYFTHGTALISIFWLLLWCFVWLYMMGNMGDKAEMYIKHTSYLHLFGVGFSMGGYVTGWMTPVKGKRSARFLMVLGWAVSYMAWFNLVLQPTLRFLWAPAIGGLLVVLGAFLVARSLKAPVEAPMQVA